MSRPRVRTAPESPDHRACITSMLAVLIGACEGKGKGINLPARNHCQALMPGGGIESAVRRAGASVRPVAATGRSK